MSHQTPWTAVGVPIDSVGRSGGTEHAPRALRDVGVLEALGARDGGDLDVHIRDEHRDEATGVVGIDDVLTVTATVRTAVRDLVAAGERPFVLGGCCTLLPGALAGVRDVHGSLGVVNVDGHVDVYDGSSSPTGEAADMPVGVALGRAPAPWVAAAGGPSTTPGKVVVLGARDEEERADVGSLLGGELAELHVLQPTELRSTGLRVAAQESAERLADRAGRFWLHLDVDVLDESEMPATDYLMPDGLDWDELAELLVPLGASPALAGVSVACLNPEKDPDGEYTERTRALLANAFG
ncbi:MAG TPA: arginase family protein [Thermoleophilaceae bacterium]|nr:arginase family protein [Thermoleophilaceae bacterium]